MGNSASSAGRSQHEETVDYGYLYPQGVYSGSRDWNQGIVTQLILDRRLAPFYRPLEEYDERWDDERILAARKQLPDNSDVATSESSSRVESSSVSRSNSLGHASRRSPTAREFGRIPEAMVYRGAVECPICFLYYPPNINHSRCCDQAICTECFVQIKRNEPTVTHCVSEPAACPYCVQENFGVTYVPPVWRTGLGSEGSPSPSQSIASRNPSIDASAGKDKGRRKSFSHDAAEVVTIDQIRPDWEAKLAAVRAAVARRANRRIIMRQVGDRLIPVGVTSGRIQPLNVDTQGEQAEGDGESRTGRRSRRRQHQQAPQDLTHLLGSMGLGGQDLEELMVMEAMRLSLLEHEEQQRREAENKKKAAQGGASAEGDNNGAGPSSSTPRDTTSSPKSSTSVPRDIPSVRPSPTTGSSTPSSSLPQSGSTGGASHLSGRLHTPVIPSPLSNGNTPASVPTEAVPGSVTLGVSGASGSPSSRRTPSPQLPGWRGSEQQGSPLRHSTLSAAIAAHSTAAAIIGGRDFVAPESSEPERNTEGGWRERRELGRSGSGTGNVGEEGTSMGADEDRQDTGEVDRQKVERKSTTNSSVVGMSARYDELPSSPESTAREPLLRDDGPTEERG